MASLLRYWSCATDPTHRHEQKHEAVLCESRVQEEKKKLQGDYFKIGDRFVQLGWHVLTKDGQDPADDAIIWVIVSISTEQIYSRPSEDYQYARRIYTLVSSAGKTKKESGKSLSYWTRPSGVRRVLINNHKSMVGIPNSIDDWSPQLRERLHIVVKRIQKKADRFNPK